MRDCQSSLEDGGGSDLNRDKDPAMILGAGLEHVALGESQCSSGERLNSLHPAGTSWDILFCHPAGGSETSWGV